MHKLLVCDTLLYDKSLLRDRQTDDGIHKHRFSRTFEMIQQNLEIKSQSQKNKGISIWCHDNFTFIF